MTSRGSFCQFRLCHLGEFWRSRLIMSMSKQTTLSELKKKKEFFS